jgi:predicted nucleic acid-binding protein
MTYVDASAILRVVFAEPGLTVVLAGPQRVVSSEIVEVEAFRAIDRARLLNHLDDRETAVKRKALTDLVAMLDLASVDRLVIDRAKGSFAINLRALDAIHVATAEILMAEAPGEPLEFWTHDDRQATAALSRGLTVRGAAEDAGRPPAPALP